MGERANGEKERERERERACELGSGSLRTSEDREREEDGREALEPTTRLGTDGSRKKGL